MTDERGLDETNMEHLGEAPNPKQLVQDRKLNVSERMRLQGQGILLPPSYVLLRLTRHPHMMCMRSTTDMRFSGCTWKYLLNFLYRSHSAWGPLIK